MILTELDINSWQMSPVFWHIVNSIVRETSICDVQASVKVFIT